MENYVNILSLLILFSSFMLMSNKRLKSYIKTFQFQSVLIAIASLILGIESIYQEGHFDILIICIIIIILKVIYIPNLLTKTYANVEYKVEKDFFLNIPILILVCCGLVLFSYFSISTIDGINEGKINIQIINSVSLILIGI